MIRSSGTGTSRDGGANPDRDQTPLLTHPPVGTVEPLALLCDSLDWARGRALSKLAGLDDARLRACPAPPGWSPLGLVSHLTWVERRWMRWGFLGEPVAPYPTDRDEWDVDGLPTEHVLSAYRSEGEHSDRHSRASAFDTPSRLGGRFLTDAQAPTLGRVLVHLHQEYSRHLGQLDVVRELLDGATGE